MLFYDLALGAWVQKPGSSSSPWMTPVLTAGSSFNLTVDFCCGENVVDTGATAYFAGLKIENDFAGAYLASDAAPYQNGTDGEVFTLDLATPEALIYFTTNPSEPTVNCALQIGYTLDGESKKTVPLQVVLQNDYLKDQ